MQFEWAEPKRHAVLLRRGIDFARAALIFFGDVVTEPDRRFPYGEDRFISIGKVGADHYVVAHTTIKDTVRIITCWRAGRRARNRYQALLARRAAGDA